MRAVLEAYRARVLDAARGRPWEDGVPGSWITGDRILDITLLPVAWALGFVLLHRLLVAFSFQVRAPAARSPAAARRAALSPSSVGRAGARG
jgi:hypothetical protein